MDNRDLPSAKDVISPELRLFKYCRSRKSYYGHFKHAVYSANKNSVKKFFKSTLYIYESVSSPRLLKILYDT